MCAENYVLATGMLKVNQPDVIIVSMSELRDVGEHILTELSESYSDIPLICIGTETDKTHYDKVLQNKTFFTLRNPINKELLLSAIEGAIELQDKQKTEKVESSKKCILLVDDNTIQLRMLKSMLWEEYDILMASSGMKALTQIGKRMPDLILLDYEMPECDGKMTLEMIREMPEAKQVPVIFLTGVSDRVHIEAVLKLKPAGYLLKPASKERLMEEIGKHL